MQGYVFRRLLGMVLTIVVASIISFAAIELPPGSYLSTYRAQLQAMDMTPDQIEGELAYVEARFALSQPVYVRYGVWVGGLLRGDLGYSMALRRPVSELIGDRMLLTLVLALASVIFTFVVGVGAGVITAMRPYSVTDNVVTLSTFVFLAVPNFLLAISAIYFWVTVIGGAPQFGLQSPAYVFEPWSLAKFGDLLAHLWLPVIIIGASHAAAMLRVVRARMLEVLPDPFVQTARMKGLRERRIVLVHALRAAINPVISATALSLPAVIGGEIITSIVLQLNTIGPLLFEALMAQDMYLAATILLMLTVILVVANLIADLVIAWLDPRIAHG
ncbi:MAG: ABC transporter permease [Myxococcales bacterium]|nr:ABC transporter permease [Myxococcales bacterium]